jgi:hypothetical protein
VAKRGRGTEIVRARAARGAQPGSLGTVPEKRVLGGRGLSSGLGPDTTIRVVEPALEVIRVVEPDLGIEVGREVRESLRQDQKLVDSWERTRTTDLDTKDVQAKGKDRETVISNKTNKSSKSALNELLTSNKTDYIRSLYS